MIEEKHHIPISQNDLINNSKSTHPILIQSKDTQLIISQQEDIPQRNDIVQINPMNQNNYSVNQSSQSNHKMDKKSSLIHANNNEDFFFSEEELFHSDRDEPSIIKKAKLIKDCTILRYGIKPSIELIDYTFCKTCDINLIHPICISCVNICHIDHNVKKNYLKGHIKCVCGEKLHSFGLVNTKEEEMTCLLQEWSIQSNLLTFYSTPTNQPLCIFCHNYCSDTKDQNQLVKETDKLNIPQCLCRSEKVHSEFKIMYEKINCLSQENNLFVQRLLPIQIINMIFLSKISFNSVYANFIETMRGLTDKSNLYSITSNITSTNCYHSLNNFSIIAYSNSHNALRYYCKEIENYFSFNTIQKLFPDKIVHDTSAYWSFYQKIFFLFHKVYIGNHTQTMDKYKLYDLENISPMQRLGLFHWNKDHFSESNEIVTYLYERLASFSLSGFSQIDAYDTIIQVSSILKRLAEFSLIANNNMISICLELEKLFSPLSLIRKQNSPDLIWEKEKKWFFIIIKMLHYFVYTYNDRIIKNILTNKVTYPTLEHITFENTLFLFEKTDLGRLISRLSIRIMSTIQKYYCCKEESDIYQKIMRHGMKIMSYIINNYDSYLLSLNKLLKNSDYYLEMIEMTSETSPDYQTIYEQHQSIENAYRDYYSFRIQEDVLITILDKTLQMVNTVPIKKRNICVMKSNYFNSITKVLQILNFRDKPDHKAFLDKFLLFLNSFIQESSDNSLLLLSHYILITLIRVPISFGVDVFKLIHQGIQLIKKYDSVISFSKHILKISFQYLETLRNNTEFKDINTCLLLFLEILYCFSFDIKCLNVEISNAKSKNYFQKIHTNFPQVLSYMYNAKCSEDEKKITFLFLKLANNLFNSSDIKDRRIQKSFINKEDIMYLLKNKTLALDIRTEVIVFLRHTEIDIYYLDSRDDNYANSIIACEDKLVNIKTNPLISYFKYPTKLLTFCKELMNNSLAEKIEGNEILLKEQKANPNSTTRSDKCLEYLGYELLYNEMINIKMIVEVADASTDIGKESLRNYFENGILIPLTVYLKKTFSIVHLFSGDEILTICELITLILKTKLFIASFKVEFWPLRNIDGGISNCELDRKNSTHSQEPQQMINGYNKSHPMIIGDFCFNDYMLHQTESDYNQMNSKKFSPFDYTRLYQIAEHHLFSIIDNLEAANIANDFNEGDDLYSLKALKELEKENYPNYNSMTDTEKRIIRVYNIYKIAKESINDERSCLFSCLPEICLEFETNFRNLLISILISKGSQLGTQQLFARSSYFLLYKLLSIQTTETQSDIIALLGGNESEELGFMANFSKNLFQRLIILFVEDFNPQDRRLNIDYVVAYNLIKIFKFLCEEHNNFFQGRLIKNVEIPFSLIVPSNIQKEAQLMNIANPSEKSTIMFFDFMLHILAKIILVSKWEKITNDTIKNVDYLYDLFAAILELLIETIQGNKPEYLSKVGNTFMNQRDDNDDSNDSFLDLECNDSFQKFVEFVIDILFRNDSSNELIFQIRNQLMMFFTSILEEKNCNEEVQKFIIKNLNLNRVILSINCILKNYYFEQHYYQITQAVENNTINNNQEEEESIKRDKTLSNKKTIVNNPKQNQLKVKFNSHMYESLTKAYFYTDFSKTNEFQLANIFYRYIKLISVQGKSDEATELIRKVNMISISKANSNFNTNRNEIKAPKTVSPMNLINENIKTFDDDFIEKYYIVKFFESITETVEVRTGDKTSMNQTVIFTVLPQMIYLSTGTKHEFIKRVNRDSEITKKNDLIRHVEYFQKEIKYYQKSKTGLFKLMSSVDFTYVQTGLYLFAVAFNLFVLFTLHGDKRIQVAPETNSDERLLRNLNEKGPGEIIAEFINSSISEWTNYYNSLSYLLTGLNGFFIILWLVFRMPLYYRLDKIRFMEVNKITDKSQITIWNKIKIALVDTIYVRDYITTLLYMFIVSLIGSILSRGEMSYPFLLLAIINLNPTLKNIIVSIQMKYLELVLTYLLAFIIMFVYANIGFFFFNSDFEAILDGNDDNFCNSMVFCFLSTLDYAIRNRGGIGDLMTRISFERNRARYVGRVIFDVTFFLLIVIIMIDLVFGIIIESFQELRNNEQKHYNDRKSHCFICHVNRATVEKNRQDFNEHREKRHYVWSYVNYMISLKFSDIHDLNAINSYARDKLDNKSIDWLPTYKDLTKDDAQINTEDNDENLKVEQENITKHLVKEA